ncbi:MFS transporter [Snodgrassella sp. CFCC 13594]|uniref:AmpG family muropeptide MFS transporter n=1 Tax=Snodgrassella sp. CFCC 13594 TaxID=1775559 RepID=UPI00082A9CB0|nr:MFS transporter [Snodgrassella sp. CFCC 13594]
MTSSSSLSRKRNSWQQALAVYGDRRALTMLFLGFSSGVPLLLIFSTLSLWLREAGVERSTVTMFSWAALAYSFKFVWAPLIDALPLPGLTRWLGRRRAWLLVAQLLIVIAILWIALIDPHLSGSLMYMAFAAVLLGFSSATQDIVVDAYRIELAEHDTAMQSVMAATYNAGYRIGMVIAGAGALFLADVFGSNGTHYQYQAWQHTYFIMASVMLVGIITTFIIRETQPTPKSLTQHNREYARLVLVFALCVVAFIGSIQIIGLVLPESASPLWGFALGSIRLLISIAVAVAVGLILVKAGMVSAETARTTWLNPILDFFNRYGKAALWLLALIGLYRISDIVSGVISNVFYEDMGFSKTEIAAAVKTFGVIMSIGGGFVGGLLAQRYSLMKLMAVGAILAALTNLLFVGLAWRGHDVVFMYLAVAADNLASGLAGAVFVAFLSALTSIRFTAVQYAIFSSLMTLIPKTLGGYSGTIVDHIGYPGFFTFTALIGAPVLLLIYQVNRMVRLNDNP